MGKAHAPVAGWAVVAAAFLSGLPEARGDSRAPADAFYAALHGDPEPVGAGVLIAAPGRFVGHAVRTRGHLHTLDANALRFELSLERTRARLQLEPEAKAVLVARASAWDGRVVEVDGLFYRDEGGPAGSAYALRVWRVRPLDTALRLAETPAQDTPALSLEELVYGAGRYDGRVVRVRGRYRGPNRHRDLPETSRRGRGDWVIKDGYFAAWVTGHEARGERWDLTRRSAADAEATVEVVGIPTTAGGVVRIAARRVDLSLEAGAGTAAPALATPRDAGVEAVSPRVSFAFPVPGETLRPRGWMILQFSKPLDPRSLESRVRVRYEGGAAESAAPRVTLDYRDRNRALVLMPEPAPPPRTDVVVELLEGIIDVDGRALAPSAGAPEGGGGAGPGVVDRVRFRSAP